MIFFLIFFSSLCNILENMKQFHLLSLSQLHCVLVPYLSLPREQLKIRLSGGSLSLVLSGSEHYASLIPNRGLNKLSPSPLPYYTMPWLVAHLPTTL